MIDEINSYCWDVPAGQMEGEGSVTPSFIDELHSWDIQGYQMEGEGMVLLEVSFMNFIVWISKEIK